MAIGKRLVALTAVTVLNLATLHTLYAAFVVATAPHALARPIPVPRVFAQATQLANAAKLSYFNGNLAVSNPGLSRIYKFLPSGALDAFSYNFTGAIGFDVGDYSTNPLYVWKYSTSQFGVIGYKHNAFGTAGALNAPWDNVDVACRTGQSLNRVPEVDFHRNSDRLLLVETNSREILWSFVSGSPDTTACFNDAMWPIVFPANYNQAGTESLRHLAQDPHSDLFYFTTAGYVFSSTAYSYNSAALILSKADIQAATGNSNVDITAFTSDGQQLFFYEATTAKLYRADMTMPTIQIQAIFTDTNIQAVTGNPNGVWVKDIDVELNPATGKARSILLLDGLADSSGRGAVIQIFLGP